MAFAVFIRSFWGWERGVYKKRGVRNWSEKMKFIYLDTSSHKFNLRQKLIKGRI